MQKLRKDLVVVGSALLVCGSLGLLVLTALPVLGGFLFAQQEEYRPQLPLAGARGWDFLRIQPNRQPYPPLHDVVNVEHGNWIRIPSLNVHTPLVTSNSMQDGDIIEALRSGVALYPNGVLPGRNGNVFISAHSTGYPWQGKYRFAFLRIGDLAEGNVIHLDFEGTRYTYTVTLTEIVTPSPDLQIESGRPLPSMTLMACWPLWSTDKRMLVQAHLTNVTHLPTSHQVGLLSEYPEAQIAG